MEPGADEGVSTHVILVKRIRAIKHTFWEEVVASLEEQCLLMNFNYFF